MPAHVPFMHWIGYCSGDEMKSPDLYNVCGPELPLTWLTMGINQFSFSRSQLAADRVSGWEIELAESVRE